jgi:hypothetical protein
MNIVDGYHFTLPRMSNSNIQEFRMLFENRIRYCYPNERGIRLLFFKKNDHNRTPFQCACEEFGYEEVMKVVDDTLIRYSDTPINITEALITAAIDEHLDCMYFLLRRQPDVLHKLLSSSTTSIAAHAEAAGSINNNNNNNFKSKLRKRKRGL